MQKKRPASSRVKPTNKLNDKKEIHSKKEEEKEEFVFALNISDKYNSLLDIPELIFIIDISSDMKQYINKIRIEIIPKLVSLYSLPQSKKFHVITFGPESEHFELDFNEITNPNLLDYQNIYVSNVFEKLKNTFDKFKEHRNIKIITISNGNFCDYKNALTKSEEFLKLYSKKFLICSLGINIKTPLNNPSNFNIFLNLHHKNTNNDLIEVEPEFNSNELSNKILEKLYEESGWKIFIKGKEILFIPFGNGKYFKKITEISEKDFYENLKEREEAIINKVAVQKGVNTDYSIKLNQYIINIFEYLFQNSKDKNIKDDYLNIITNIKTINDNKKVEKLNNKELAEYISDPLNKNKESKKKDIKITLEDANDEKNKKVNTEPKEKIANKPSFKRKISKEQNKIIIEKTTKTETKKDDNKNEIKPVIKDKDKKNEIKKNQVNEQKKQTPKEKKEIQKKNTIEKSKPNIEKKLTNDNTIKESEFILIIDGASEMKDHFKNLINNILYNFLKKLYNDEEKKIFFFSFNSSDIEEKSFPIKKLQTLKIEPEGERKIMDLFEKIFNKIKIKKEHFVNILFLTSGKIDLSDSKSTNNLNEINTKYKIKLVNYLINQNENYENEEFLNFLNKIIPNNDKKFFALKEDNESNEKNIEILINLFKQ
jgi:hypothetical protein